MVAEGVLRRRRAIHEEFGLARIFITHDLATVPAIADDVAVMSKGRIVEQGDRETVFAPPNDPYTQQLVVRAADGSRLAHPASPRQAG